MKRAAATSLVCLLLASFLPCLAQSRVEFKDNRLKVDGKPFFFYGCWGTPNKNYVDFKRRHFNTAFLGWAASVEEGPKAAEAGLMVIPYPYAPGWTQKVADAMKSIADKDWVLAWNIGDDLNKKEHLEAALKVRDVIRAIDPQKRPIMFDAIGMYEEFAKIPDMWCAYAYPLVKDAAAAPPARKPGGLSEYGDWLNRMRLLGREGGFFWTWTQCHVQIPYSKKYLGGTDKDKWKHSRFPDGDHLRLIAAHAISSGCRGLMWFVSRYFEDEYYGRDRYARASAIGCELDIVGPFIAQGRVGERIKTSDPTVRATPVDFPGGRLVCLLKTGDDYHYQPDAAEAKDVQLPGGYAGSRMIQIGPELRGLSEPKVSFHLATWVLITEDNSFVQMVRERYAAVLPDMARFTAEELEARIEKVKPIFAALSRGQEDIAKAEAKLADARKQLDGKDWTRAALAAEAGITLVRTAQHRVWRDTLDDMAKAGLNLKIVDFYLLPGLAKYVNRLNAGAWGESGLKNGSFESHEGWSGGKLGRDPKDKAALIAGAGRENSQALRLMADAPRIYRGEPRDWVTASAISDKIPAACGEIWEIAAWVRVPKAFEQTSRGVTIALFAYDANGKPISGYGAQALETPQVEATEGWKRMRLIVPLRSDEIVAVAARLAISGVGEAYLDDVTVRRLQDKP